MNSLQYETSPYLLQHAHNPVDWHAWKPEAFEKAHRENKPILVSIGYSTCHWCHVMERESFEEEKTAAFMNAHFVNIKVDREERPDVDHIYMEACQIISGSGGWPLNCFLLPDKRPFFAGTYYPPKPAFNRPSWMQLLQHIANLYQNERHVVEDQATRLTEIIQNSDTALVQRSWSGVTYDNPINPVVVQNAYYHLKDSFDAEDGGFGGAPKFPGAMNLQFLLGYAHFFGAAEAFDHVAFSLKKMIGGGIYDQLGGGFARYATDKAWLVPHFEKMLYDNALLVQVMAEAYQRTGEDIYRRAIEETLQWVEREMTHPQGGFFSALDADSEGVEGKFYVWDKQEIDEILGESAFHFNAMHGVTVGGNWEGKNILWRPIDTASYARHIGWEEARLRTELEQWKSRMVAERSKRVRPALDDKVLLGWNALQASAYAHAYAALGTESYKTTAERNILFLLDALKKEEGEGLYHTWKDGSAQYDAFLDDYALLIEALLDLYSITFKAEYLEQARKWARFAWANFLDNEVKLFYFTGAMQQDIPIRRKDIYDSAMPSGNSTMVHNLLRLRVLLDEPEYGELAVAMLEKMRDVMERYPSSFGRWMSAYLWAVYPPKEIAVVGRDWKEWANSIAGMYLPHKILMAGHEGDDRYPLLAGKEGGEKTYIYVCESYACQMPVDSLAAFTQLVTGKKS
ncbi:MAG: thioredoxin domain-containing protein [Saprospirales bacterium]|nr:thioredoxin domain-containing protein [Saprospirales bacterium]MBK8491712.1 thioredoxin domain-containing protein [Saprospirales bacterium]